MSTIQKLTIAYFFMFAVVVALDFVPGFKDSQGYLFGLFVLDLYDHSLYAFSGLWALVAGLISRQQAVFYFKTTGHTDFLALDPFVQNC